MHFRKRLLVTSAITPVLMLAGALPSAAQSGLPAVAYPNVTVGGATGTWFNQVFGVGEGRLTLPLGHSFGAQADAVFGSIGGETYAQVAAHLFWRDPATALFGIYGAWVFQGGMSSGRVAPEAELYLDNVTLSGLAGVAFGEGVSSHFFAQVKGSLYLGPNHKLYAGYAYEGTSTGFVGLEAFHPNARISGFVEGRFAGNGNALMGGLRFYSGTPGKSLKDREREDVAPLWMHVGQQTTPGTTEPPTTEAPTTEPPTTEPPTTEPPTTEPPTTEPPTTEPPTTEPPTTGA